MHFGTWLSALRAEEIEDGFDHYKMACRPEELTPYVRANLADAVGVLADVDKSIPKGVSDQELREFWEDFRPQYIRRIREALDHVGAALTAVGCTDKQLELAAEKTQENAKEASPELVPVYICAICEKETRGLTVEPLFLHSGAYLCSEECEDKYDGVETVRITVSDVTQMLPEEQKR